MIVYRCSRCGAVLYASVKTFHGVFAPSELARLLPRCPRCGKPIEFDGSRISINVSPVNNGSNDGERFVKALNEIVNEYVVPRIRILCCVRCGKRVRDPIEHVILHHLRDVVMRANR